MANVTLDTNLVDDQKLLAAAAAAGFHVARTTVTDRELSDSGVSAVDGRRAALYETGVVGESIVGLFVVGEKAKAVNFEELLEIISNGAFPRGEKRKDPTEGQRRQIRDAMIFCTHAREKRDIFVTNDRKGFINDRRRELLEQRFAKKIFMAEEFLSVCNASHINKNVYPCN